MSAFAGSEMALGYARSRPALHGSIVGRVRAALGIERLGRLVVDVGCGSGLSVRPLVGLAERVVGLEPVLAMASMGGEVARGAEFVCGRGEALPFGAETVDAVTMAGSLNYARVKETLAEARRVLTPDGVLCVYDFAQGRRFANGGELEDWFEEFVRRYPRPVGSVVRLNGEAVGRWAEGFRVVGGEDFEIELAYRWGGYADYMMTETNVAAALGRGVAAGEVRGWIESTLPAVFGEQEIGVVFPGYWVALRPQQ